MAAFFEFPLLRSHLTSALGAAVLACGVGGLIIHQVSERSHLESHVQRHVLRLAEQLAGEVGGAIAKGDAGDAGQAAIEGLMEHLTYFKGIGDGGDACLRLLIRDDGQSDFRVLAESGVLASGMGVGAAEVLEEARLGHGSFRIGPRYEEEEAGVSGGNRVAKRMVVAAAGYRRAPESEVSVLAQVQMVVEEANSGSVALFWGGLLAVALSGLVAAAVGILSWRPVSGELTATESAMRKMAAEKGEYRLMISRKDQLGRVQEGINELAARLQESRDEVRRLQKELKDSAKRAGVAEQAKADFLANMSHEVRTPMNGILGTLSLLDETDLMAGQRRLLEMVRASGERLLRVVNDILDYGRLESAQVTLEKKRVCLEDLTVAVARAYAPSAADKGVEFLTFLDPRLPQYIEGDEVRLRQVLDNLVENAVKFTAHGEIQLEVHAGLRENGRRFLAFSVTDTGLGINEAKQKQLYAAFSQQDTSTTRAHGGAGLGLAICKKLSELHQGELHLESVEGKGSRFSFEIPLRLWKAQVPAVDGERIPIGGKVGFVTRNDSARYIVERYLKEWGMSFVPLSREKLMSGVEGLQAVVCDADSVGPGELEVLRKAGGSGIAVLFVHGTIWEMPAGFSSVKEISKPFGPTELRRALAEAIHPEVESFRKELPGNFAVKHPARILVVEDQPMNQKIVQMMLRKLGYEVRIANNGREGVDVVAENGTDLVFMDLQMPVLGGVDATREIRKNFHLRRQPVIIAMTGYALSGVRESCLEAGMNDFLTKPLSVDDLREAIERSGPLLKAA